MEKFPKYPAHQAWSVIHGSMKVELALHVFDEPERTKAHLFAIGGPAGKQFAIVVGEYDAEKKRHDRQRTRILLERCAIPDIPGVESRSGEPYNGSRVKQSDSNLAAPNQSSCLVADEAALKSLLRWYAARL
ncbi:hypothetical protein [Caballeronia sp. RCC_10]|uniref:hypothetical protein n=1 Tax=Caballeronia sp. RCC_10 TaxID=3239227 RepID=UPI003526A840